MRSTMSNAKIKQLLEQKDKIEKQLEAEKIKRLEQIGKRAQKHGILDWSNKAFDGLFKMASEKGEQEFLPKSED